MVFFAAVEDVNETDWFCKEAFGVVALDDVSEADWFPKAAELLENENILGWLLNDVTLHWSLFPVVFEFENNIGWFTEGVELPAGKNELGLLPGFAPVFENEKSIGWPSDNFSPLERKNWSYLLHEDAFVFGNENEFPCSFLNNVAFERENKFDWYPESDVAVEGEKQSRSLLDGIIVPAFENKLGWLSVDVVEFDNANRLWRPANDFWRPAGGNIIGWSHDTTVVLGDEDKHECMAGGLVLLNDLKSLGWSACTTGELQGERYIVWLADTVVVLGSKDNFDWLPDDMALLAGENKLPWLHDVIAAREEIKELSWVIDNVVVNLDWLSHNDVVFEDENNLGWLSGDIILSVFPEDADILENKESLDWLADDIVVLTSIPGTLAADNTVFESE